MSKTLETELAILQGQYSELSKQVRANTTFAGTVRVDIAEIKKDIGYVRKEVSGLGDEFKKMTSREQKTTVRIAEMGPVRLIVFGAVGLILSAFFSALVALVISNRV